MATTKKKRRTIAIIAAAVVVVLVGAVAIYLDRIAPFRSTVITVDNVGVSMRTFLQRTNYADESPLTMLKVLADEQIVKLEAPNPPYGVEVTEDDLNTFLHQVAAGSSDTIDEDSFKEWYRQQVNNSRMPESVFREFVASRLLMTRFHEYLANQVPTVAEQVELNMFPVNGYDSALAAKARIESGESFAAIAAELSTDDSVAASGGSLGWQARAGLAPGVASIAFDKLAIGEVSDPYFLDGDMFALIMVSDRSDMRELDDTARKQIQDRVLDEWLVDAQKRHEVDYHGFAGGGYDAETDSWVKWQLEKMKK